MKKLLLLTWYENNNYGTSLQAYALKTVIENPLCTGLMNDTDSLDSVSCVLLRHRPERMVSKVEKIKKVFSLEAYLHKIEQYQDNKIRLQKTDLFECRKAAFEQFNCDNFVFSGNENLQTVEELEALVSEYDIVASGSDQIWNPEALDPTYLLEWVPAEKKIISYGSSLSINIIPAKFYSLYRRALSRFNRISIRDVACKDQLSKIVGKKIQTVVDPVILLGADELLRCAANSKVHYGDNDYIFCYFLGNNKTYRDLVIQYARDNNLNIRAIINTGSSYVSDNVLEEYSVWNAGPWEFVNLIKNATIVITDSFHATVVSTLMKTQFCVFEKDSSRPEQNNRIKEFLADTGLDSRWSDSNTIPQDKISREDWNLAHERLNMKRKRSLEYLLEALC